MYNNYIYTPPWTLGLKSGQAPPPTPPPWTVGISGVRGGAGRAARSPPDGRRVAYDGGVCNRAAVAGACRVAGVRAAARSDRAPKNSIISWSASGRVGWWVVGTSAERSKFYARSPRLAACVYRVMNLLVEITRDRPRHRPSPRSPSGSSSNFGSTTVLVSA